MVGLGETRDELTEAFEALRAVDVDILTIGQYLRPSLQHLPLERYYHPDEFAEMKAEALALGFKHVESAPLVRSSYHARDQVPGAELKRARAARRRSTPRAGSSPSRAEVPSMVVDRSYVARNDASRQRLAARLDDLTANELLTPVEAGWTVGGLLAHLAFWDRLVLERWALAEREGKATPIDIRTS